MLNRIQAVAAVCALSLSATGCVLGPASLRNSRTNYNQAVQQTAREEMLLNLVRLKYYQSEEFIRVPSITGQFTYSSSLGGSGTWQEGAAARLSASLGLGATSRPTIVYTPEQAQEFNQRLLTPISLETIDLLTSKGWAINRVLRVTVRNINDVDNATSAGGPTPSMKPDFEEFAYVCELLRHLQKYGQRVELTVEDQPDGEPVQLSAAIPSELIEVSDVILADEKGYDLQPSDDGKTMHLWTRASSSPASVVRIAPEAVESQEVQEIRRILELKTGLSTYRIEPDTYGQLARPHSRRTSDEVSQDDRENLVVSTRSLKEMMFYLCHGISVPAEHLESGLVQTTLDESGAPFDWAAMTGDLFCVRVQQHRPKHSAVAVKHRGYWYYIDESDLDSKATFNLLLELFNLEIRAGGGAQIPLLTI